MAMDGNGWQWMALDGNGWHHGDADIILIILAHCLVFSPSQPVASASGCLWLRGNVLHAPQGAWQTGGHPAETMNSNTFCLSVWQFGAL